MEAAKGAKQKLMGRAGGGGGVDTIWGEGRGGLQTENQSPMRNVNIGVAANIDLSVYVSTNSGFDEE